MRASAIAAAVVVLAGGCRDPASSSAPVGRGAAQPGYLKGQLHVHSNHSGDSRTAPADVVRWYRERGFDFIVFTDHNAITTFDASPGMLVIPAGDAAQSSSASNAARQRARSHAGDRAERARRCRGAEAARRWHQIALAGVGVLTQVIGRRRPASRRRGKSDLPVRDTRIPSDLPSRCV